MGKCMNFKKGNIIAWDLQNFQTNQVIIEDLENEEDLCLTVDQLLVFPKKRSWNAAWTLCIAHGGNIHTPIDENENLQLSATLEPYKDKCADPVSGNLAWLGIKSENYVWERITNRNKLAPQNFTNWASSAPYYDKYDCGFIRVDGTWDSDTNCGKQVKLCTVCKLSGKEGIKKPRGVFEPS